MKCIEDILCVLGIDKRRERHSVHQIYIILLVWPMLSVSIRLYFERCPHVMQKHQYIRNTLQIVRIVLEDDGVWITPAKRVDELRLECTFSSVHSSLSLANDVVALTATRFRGLSHVR